MKKIVSILMMLFLCLTFYSCMTSTYAQTDDMYDDVDVNVIVTYGTPYYNTNGLLLYYFYKNMYYYPYYYDNAYHFHRYHRPLPPHRMERYRPIPRDFYKHGNVYRHHKYSRPHMRPNRHPNYRHNNHNGYGGRNFNRHENRSHRQLTPKSSTRHHSFGGRR